MATFIFQTEESGVTREIVLPEVTTLEAARRIITDQNNGSAPTELRMARKCEGIIRIFFPDLIIQHPFHDELIQEVSKMCDGIEFTDSWYESNGTYYEWTGDITVPLTEEDFPEYFAYNYGDIKVEVECHNGLHHVFDITSNEGHYSRVNWWRNDSW